MKMLFGMFLSITVFIQLGFAIAFLYGGVQEIQNVAPAFCETPECLRAASSIRESLNVSADPCDDFYEFVCGLHEGVDEESEEEQKLLALHFFGRHLVLPYDFRRSRILGKNLNKSS